MDDAERYELEAAAWRLNASMCRFFAARSRMKAAVSRTTSSLRRFSDVVALAEKRDFESHPDIQYMNAQLDGFYDAQD
jgi:hypothetical protein